MTGYEMTTNIVIALINNSRISSAEGAAEAFKTILDGINNA